MAEEVRRKLGEVQTRLAEQSIYLRDLETRLSEVEEAVGVLVIPRIGRSSPHRSSPHEYIVEVSPAYGEPATITLTARSDKQAIEKAKEKARFPIPATAKILSKVEVESPSNLEEAVAGLIRESIVWAVLTADIDQEWRYVIIGEFYHYLNRRHVLADDETRKEIDLAYNRLRELEKTSSPRTRSNPKTKLKCKLCGKTLPTRSVKEYMEHLEREHTVFFPELVERYFYEFVENPIQSSRWVLELYPDEIPVWRELISRLEASIRLTPKEHSFMRSLDYYIQTERKITIPMLAWIYTISRREGVVMPEIPYPRAR